MKDSKEKVQKSNSWIFLLLICISTCFMGIAFANINIQLGISGEVLAEAQTELFITDVRHVSNVNADLNNSKILTSYETLLSSEIYLSQTDNNSSITYEVVIYNATDKDYKFKETTYMLGADTYDNENITFTLDGISKGSVVKSKESITFRITFKYKDNLLAANNRLKSYINFVFEPNVILASAGTLNTNSTYGVFGSSIQKGYVERLYFVDHENVPANAKVVWDASVEGNYAITGWTIDDDGNGDCDMYLGADNGRISLPADCSSLFYYWGFLKVADFANVDTSKVTNMNQMFLMSYALEELNVSTFDTSKVTNMSKMFNSVFKIKEFDLSSFDFSSLTTINGIFTGTSPELIRLDNATFLHLSNLNGVVPNLSTPLTIVVKNESERDYLKSKSYLGANTQILTVEEYNSQN